MKICVFGYIVVKRYFTVTGSKFEQPFCLIAWVYLGQNYTLMNAPVHGEQNALTPNPIACCTQAL